MHGNVPEPHRDKLYRLYWEKLGEITDLQIALVARVVSQAEVERTPAAKAAMDKEWKKLVDKSCWLEKKVREFHEVAAEAKHSNKKAHFGRIFEICSLKGSELPAGHPDQKWKGRSVFQGNRVQDEHNDHAIFAELGSSPASMEAAKVIDVFGSQPGYAKQQADARQAYTQALFEGIETWVRLPRNRWPKEWEKFKDPVCPLMLALYGHPDSGGIWEKHCTKQLASVGWKSVLPEIWQSIYYHAELDLLLVIYVDDFKMAGPKDNMQKGWDGINKVLDMDPAEVFGRYFGCNHHEGEQVMLPREAHPFAHVFDKKHAAPASRPEPERTEDWWEVDPDLGAVVRHHVYPRKRLYVPSEDDIQKYPSMLPLRITEVDGKDSICDTTIESGAARQKDWWTGKTYFPIVESDREEFRLAVAARKGRPMRSKADAKREAKESRFRGTETIVTDPVPSMSKPVNVMTYDMRDFLVSCVDRYCELAKVSRDSLKFAPTPFHDSKIARALQEGEAGGRLQPIASKVLMKVLFAARMARWDLLRATQSLASRVTKWSRDCDTALHRLICYINSSLDTYMQGFVGDRISECKLWLFCDADWAGEHDSKSTSGCALLLVGPNTYYPLNAFSKKQTSITMSSTESEVVSANHGVRAQGLPSLSLWTFLWKEVTIAKDGKVQSSKPFVPKDDTIVARIDPELDDIRYGEFKPDGRSVSNINGLNVALSDKFQVQFMEDNQATITIILKGDSEKMRHTDRTQNISFGWLRQQFERGFFNMINVATLGQVADIFTKPFSEKSKWYHALYLINHIEVQKPPWLNKKGKDSDAHIVAKPQVLAALAGRPVHELAAQFRKDADYSHQALKSVIEGLPKSNKRHMRKMIESSTPSSSYTLFGQYTHGGLQGITKATQSQAEACRYLNSFVKHHAPEDFRWTSVVISVNAKSKLHADVHNLPGSCNFTTSCGNYTGGQLWIEDPLAKGPQASTQQLPNGTDILGKTHVTKYKSVVFDPSQKHVVLPWKGDRYSLIAFSTRGFPKLSCEECKQLSEFGFRLPHAITAAAHAPLTRRPLNYDRVMVEFCCSPESKLGQAREASNKCHVVRVTEADDATKSKTIQALVSKIHTLCDEGGGSGSSKPLLLFASLPCAGGCPWQRINIEKNPELVKSHQELFIKLFRSFQSLCRMVRSRNPCIAFELPKNCEYWSWDIVKNFAAKYNLVPTHCDGCMLGIRDKNDLPIKKSWQISCTFPLLRLQARVCDRSHSHGESRGSDLKHAEEYTFDMVDAIHSDWKDHAHALAQQACRDESTYSRQSQTLAACAILAGLVSTPPVMTTTAGLVQQGKQEYTQFWHQSMWSASLAEEFKLAGGDVAYGKTIMASYEGCPPQMAVQVSFNERDAPGLHRLAKISDRGLQMLKPESIRGRRRVLVICSDSFTVFQKSNRGFTDLAGDLEALRADGTLSAYEKIVYRPLWGKSLPHIVHQITNAVQALIDEYSGIGQSQYLRVDIQAIWLGNELVGERGVFLEPCMPSWREKQMPGGYHAARGDWTEIADRICTSLGSLAALKGRPSYGEFIGAIVLIGQPNPAKCLLPDGFGEAMNTFFDFAQDLGIHTASVAEVISPFTMWDAYHFRDDSHNRRILADWLSCVANTLACEDQVSFLRVEDLETAANRFPFEQKGLIMNQMVFNEALDRFTQAARLPKHHPTEVELNPWDYAEEEAVELEILEGMRYVKAPPQVVNQQLSQMVYIGDGQYVPRENADTGFLEKVRAKMEAAKQEQAALAGRPSSSAAKSAPQKLTKEQIKAAAPYGQDNTFQVVAKEFKRLEETRKRKAKEAEEAQTADDENAALAGRPTSSTPAKLRVVPPMSPRTKAEVMKSDLGFHREDDYAFMDILPEGSLASIERVNEFQSPEDPRLVTCEQSDLPPIADVPMSHPLKTFLSGLIRGKISNKKLLFSGVWLSVQNVLDVFNEVKHQQWSTKALISLVAHDSKARFVFKGDPEDPRAELMNQPMFPIYIRASQGQSKDLEFDDSEVAKHWYSWKSAARLGNHAAFAGRPLIPIEEVPPRLYHRTVRDAAFSILNGALQPGHGSSGNAYAYFAKVPLEEMGPSTSGVRADCPIEFVFETAEVMQHAWLMESASEGVLTREAVPGSCILYIRDTASGQTLDARPAQPESQQEGATEEETSRPHGQAEAPASSTEEVPDTSSGPMLVELACEKCQRTTVPGQYICLECGQQLKAGHRATIRARVREERSKHANRIADKLGVPITELSAQHILFHTDEGETSG